LKIYLLLILFNCSLVCKRWATCACEAYNKLYVSYRSLLNEDPPKHVIKLANSKEVILTKPIIIVSHLLKLILDLDFAEENFTNILNFKFIRTEIMEEVIKYFIYKVTYTNSTAELPEFPIAPEHALEMLMAANFLDC